MASLTPGRGSEEQRKAKKRALIAALEKGHTRRAAADLAGIAPPTFYVWLREDLTFSNAVSLAEAKAEDVYLSAIHSAVTDDWRAAAWYMERRRSDDYARKDTITLLARLRDDVEKLSDGDLLALASGEEPPQVIEAPPVEVADGEE